MSKQHRFQHEKPFMWRLLLLEEKLLLRHLPSFLGQTVCLLLLFSLTAFLALRALPEESKPVSVHVAVVLSDNDTDPSTDFMLRLVTSAADLPSIVQLELTDYDTAVRMISGNQAAGAVILPEGFIESAMYGREMELKILLPGNSGLESFLFDELAHTAVTMLLDVQTGCYAAHEAASRYGFDYAYDDRGEEIAAAYVKTVFSRLDYFEEYSVRATGSLDMSQYYGSVAVLLLLLLSGISFGPLFSWQNAAFAQKMQIRRLHPLIQALIPLLAIISYFAILLIILLGVAFCIPAAASLTAHLNLASALNLAAVSFTCAALITAVYRLIRSRAAAVLLLFCGSILMVFLAGGFIPAAFLPAVFAKAAVLLPITPLLQTFTCAVTGVFSPAAVLWSVGWGIAFYLLASFSFLLSGRSERRAS